MIMPRMLTNDWAIQRLSERMCMLCLNSLEPDATKPLCKYCKDKEVNTKKVRYCRLKTLVFFKYGYVCTCCGEVKPWQFLQLHHVDGSGSADRKRMNNGDERAGGASYKMLSDAVKLDFPNKYGLACGCCHTSLSSRGYCPCQN